MKPIISILLFAASSGIALAVPVASPASASIPASNENEKAQSPQKIRYSFSALLENSPFKSIIKPAQSRANSASASILASRQLRFQGVITINGETEFGIFDPVTQRSYWLKLREQHPSGIYLENYNADQKILTLQSASSGKLSLSLVTPDEKPLAISPSGTYRQVQQPAQRTQTPPQQQNNNRGNNQNNRRQQRR